MTQTEDILTGKETVLNKMLDDRNIIGMDPDVIKKEHILLNSELTPDQLKLAKYICAILYRLINSNPTLTKINLYDRTVNLANEITFNFTRIENAAIRSDMSNNAYSIIFGPRLFLLLQDLKKYKQTENKGLYNRLKKEKDLKEDDIAAVLAHELGHVLMRIEKPNISYKGVETGADIYGIELLKSAGYTPTALAKFFAVMELNSEAMQKEDNPAKFVLNTLTTAIDEHPDEQTRLEIADGYLTAHHQQTGEDLFKIPTVKLPFDYFKIAETIQPPPPTPSRETNVGNMTLPHYENKVFSYDEVLKRLQNDFTPENLNALLSHDGFEPLAHLPSFDDVTMRERIQDILEKCPYQRIYEDNPKADPKLLRNARIFIDLISKPDDFLFSENYNYEPEEKDQLTVSAGFYYYEWGMQTVQRIESNVQMTHSYSDTVTRTFQLYTNDMLLDEKRYANLPAEEMLAFKRKIKYSSSAPTTVHNFIDAIFLKKVLSEPNEDKKLKLLLSVLEKEKCPEEYETRQIYIQETAKLLAKKYGTDDGTQEYLEKIKNEVLTPYFTSWEHPVKTVPNLVAKSILEEFSQQITSKRALSFEMEEIIKHNNEIAQNRSFALQATAEAAFQTLLQDCNDTDAFINFLTHDFDPFYAYNFYQDYILTLVDEKMSKEKNFSVSGVSMHRDYIEYLFGEKLNSLHQVHTMFWDGDIAVRTGILTKLLNSNKRTSEELFAYSIDKIIPPKVKNRQFLIDVIGAFVATYDERERPFLLAAFIAAQKKTNSSAEFSVGEPLKEFLENIGPAGIKLGQALGSSPSVPEDIRKVMQQMKHSASVPARWDLYHLYDSCVAKPNQKELGKILGAGSYYIAVETDDSQLKQGEKSSVYNLLRNHAKARAEDMFDKMKKMCMILEQKKQQQYTDFAKIFGGIIEKASEMSSIETDMDIGKIQDTMARQIYHNEDGTGKVLSLGDSVEATLHVANWLSHGESYKETEKVEGVHFNDFPDDKFKHDFSKAYLQLELTNIFSGNAFDHDRHGAQMKITKIDDKHYDVGIFDNGAMSQFEPTQEEQKQLGNVLNHILDELPDVKNPLSVVKYFASGKKGFAEIFNDAIQKESKDGKASNYLLAVQRGMLALNDYMCNLSNGEVLSIIYTSMQKANETTKSAVALTITEQNMKKLNNLASYLSKNNQEKNEEASQKKKQEKTELTPTQKLDNILVRIKKSMNFQKVHFTLSRFLDASTKKLGLSIATRSRLAKKTDSFIKFGLSNRIQSFRLKATMTGLASSIPIFLSAILAPSAISGTLLAGVSFGLTALFFSGYGPSDLMRNSKSTKRKTIRGIFDLAEKVKDKFETRTSNLVPILATLNDSQSAVNSPIFYPVSNTKREKTNKREENTAAILSQRNSRNN